MSQNTFTQFQLPPDATLADLPSYDFQVDDDTLGKIITDRFKAEPELPGVIVMDDDRVLGVISQRRFFERMTQQYSLDLYSRRPLKAFLETTRLNIQPLILPYHCTIADAANQALSRSLEFIYEPLLVVGISHEYRLVDVNVLLMAEAQILVSVNTIIEGQRQHAQQLLENLTLEQARTREYAQQLEAEKLETQRTNRILENQQRELRQQARQITALNQRFIEISRLLSMEGKKAFQATFAGVNSICQTTDQVRQIGEVLERELEIVDSATKQIEHVSRQVKHLALQAALIVNRAGGEMSGFEFITTEINNLGTQTAKANSQVNEIASRFHLRIKELVEAAQSGEGTARSLIQKIQQAEIALNELESLLGEQPQESGLWRSGTEGVAHFPQSASSS